MKNHEHGQVGLPTKMAILGHNTMKRLAKLIDSRKQPPSCKHSPY
jgi:hypothetical protein